MPAKINSLLLIVLLVCLYPPFSLFAYTAGSLTTLSLEEKVGQLLIVHFNGLEANEEARKLIQEVHVGGFIYYNWSNGLENLDQVKNLSRGLQTLSKIPLWISIDQEGGPVARLKAGVKFFPGNRVMAQSGNPEWAEESAYQGGLELKAVGINMNFAPVVDISSDPATSYMAKRTFGDTPECVIKYARAVLQGYQRAHVIPVLKHFPGYGDVEIDPHADLPICKKTIEDLEQVELSPYVALSSQAPAIMTAHILMPSLDGDKCATLSKKIIHDLLRKKMHYDGLVITDSLVMAGLLKNSLSIEEAAIEALEAGCDLLILGGRQIIGHQKGCELTFEQIQRIVYSIVKAVQSGRIPLQRVDEAIQRSLLLKERTIRLPAS